jgi:hypothetical protein
MKTKLFTLVLAIGLTIGAKAQSGNNPQVYPTVSLYDIQYTTNPNGNSPYMNQYVNTGGIVTAIYSYGYYVQNSHATKWAAINVYDKAHKPAVGDSITMTGQVIEYYNETEIDSVKSVAVVSTGNQALTPPTVVGFDSIQSEEYEGMLVKVKDATCLRYNIGAAWWVFTDSTMTKATTSEDTVDNIIMVTQHYTPGKKYNVTGCIHFEYANWIEPRNINDIDSLNVTGINEVPFSADNVSLFPNPNNGKFTVTVNASTHEENTLLILTDITGRVIYKEQVDIHADTETLYVNAGNLAKGAYFLQISNAQSSTVKKLIVE